MLPSTSWRTLFTTLLLSSSTTLATPFPRNSRTAATTTTPVLPINDTTPSLPPPDTSWTLKAIALGLGTQNYTCADTSSAPVPHGAVASLYNAQPFLSGPAQRTTALIPILPPLALGMSDPANPTALPSLPPGWQLTPLGHHYFTAAGTPTFDLGSMLLSAKKAAPPVPAPSGACAGAGGEGAVDWLFLEDCEDGTTRGGVKAVYRVETAGGKPPASCAVAGEVVVPYTAEYWFYG